MQAYFRWATQAMSAYPRTRIRRFRLVSPWTVVLGRPSVSDRMSLRILFVPDADTTRVAEVCICPARTRGINSNICCARDMTGS